MNVALARDTLETINTAIKQRLLTNSDLVKINEIILNRAEIEIAKEVEND